MRHLDDLVVGTVTLSPSTVVDGDQMVEFARYWDPLPIHVDERAAPDGVLTAPGVFVLAVKQRLMHQLPPPSLAVIASLGYDELRFHRPLCGGDRVHVRVEYVAVRPSDTKPDRGVATLRLSLVNQHDEVVMSHLDTVLVRRRPRAHSA